MDERGASLGSYYPSYTANVKAQAKFIPAIF